MTLLEQLRRDEGVRYVLYQDSRGIPTIGVGHNLYQPLSEAAVEQILRDDLARAEAQLDSLGWPTALSEARRGVLLNMIFNLGFSGVLGFHRFLEALQRQDWMGAAQEMLDSQWAKQVGIRAVRLAEQMREDEWV